MACDTSPRSTDPRQPRSAMYQFDKHEVLEVGTMCGVCFASKMLSAVATDIRRVVSPYNVTC